jgi:hypothetical protein
MRVILLAFLGLALVAIVTGALPVRRTLTVVFVLMALYAFLKMTGVIEAIAPGRNGVF